ncbi:MAG TPA: hypothetical protein DEV93_12820 [Chloroflexi bacterium]|jgi:adenylosuccinate synthase|nr:hypothetical protein [Chloroflexota bacterium]
MPVTVVVGGQFGSEGKGKVVHFLAKQADTAITVRVGGPNSGHTVYTPSGERLVLRQLPAAAVLPGAYAVLGPGSYIDIAVLLRELELLNMPRERLLIDERAVIIESTERQWERKSGLRSRIGSTETGTGAAVTRRIARDGRARLARDSMALKRMVTNTSEFLRTKLTKGDRVIIEGTQGFGLSLVHSADYPFVTSRDTTAAGFVGEAGLSPLDVDQVVMVLRAFPIRVAGNSGPLPLETDWPTVTSEGNHDHDIQELTSVTKQVRRVANFEASVVRQAIIVNTPTVVAMNHLDYLDHECCVTGRLTDIIRDFVARVERSIDHEIQLLGIGPTTIVDRDRSPRMALLARTSG